MEKSFRDIKRDGIAVGDVDRIGVNLGRLRQRGHGLLGYDILRVCDGRGV